MTKEKQILIMFYRGPHGSKKEIPIPKNYVETSYQILDDIFNEYKEEGVGMLSAIIPSTCSYEDYDFFKHNPFAICSSREKGDYVTTANIDVSHHDLKTISGNFGIYYKKVKERKLDSYIDKIVLLSIANEEDTRDYVETICWNESIPTKKVTAYLYKGE